MLLVETARLLGLKFLRRDLGVVAPGPACIPRWVPALLYVDAVGPFSTWDLALFRV